MEYTLNKVNQEEKQILYRLLQYSLFEESATDLNEMNDQALYDYEYFDLYFTDQDRDAYLIREKQTNKLLGFAMVNSYVRYFKEGYSIAEYMILPKYRHLGLGKTVAIDLFKRYPGHFEVSPAYQSESAYQFWLKVIQEYTQGNYQYQDELFTFTKG